MAVGVGTVGETVSVVSRPSSQSPASLAGRTVKVRSPVESAGSSGEADPTRTL
jgi:hypothetical protein